jgi:hypothetical protein
MDMKRTGTLKERLMDYDIADIVTAVGTSDILEVIGAERCLEFVQAVAFGPASESRRLVRNRVRALSSGLECLEVD